LGRRAEEGRRKMSRNTISNWTIQRVWKSVQNYLDRNAILPVTSVNNQVENRLLTVSDTVTELDGEANLTYDGTTFTVNDNMVIGSAGSGHDVTFYSATSGDHFLWDASAEKLTIIGTDGQTALDISDGNVSITDDLAVNGTTNLDNTDIDGTLVVDGSNISLDSTSTFNIDCSNTSNGVTIGTATSGVPISIGNSTSETTVNDNLTITGDLTVNGTTTTINSTTLTVDDLNVVLASGAADSSAADGAGITIDGASATLLYEHTGTKWMFNKPLDMSANAITTTGVVTGGSLVCTAGATFGGGLGASGATITTAGAISADGIIKTDNTTDASSTTDGSLQTDGGLSVVLDCVFGNDVKLLSDNAVFNMGAGNDVTLTHDGTTGLTIAAAPITINSTGNLTLDSTTDIILDADGDEISLKFGGTAGHLDFTNTNSGDIIVRQKTSAKDLIFQDSDSKEGFRILDNAAGVTVIGDEAAAASLYLKADQGDDAGDEWRIQAGTSDTFAIGMDKASAGSFVDMVTLTGHATATSTTVAVAGDLTVGDDLSLTSDSSVFNMGAGNDFTITHDGDEGATIAGSPVTITSAEGATWSCSAGDLIIDANNGDLTLDGLKGITLQTAHGSGDMAGNIILDSLYDIILDADGDNVTIKFGGAAGQIDFSHQNSGEGVIKQGVDGKDLVIKQYDGTEVVRFTDDLKLKFKDDGDEWIQGTGTDLILSAGGDIRINSATSKLEWGEDSGEHIVGDGSNGLIIASGNKITLDALYGIDIDSWAGDVTFMDGGTAQLALDMDTTNGEIFFQLKVDSDDLVFKQYDGNEVIRIADDRKLYFYDQGGEHISSDGTDMTIGSGRDINLTATNDVNIPADVGITFGDDGEKIEGDGTDLTIASSRLLNLAATTDVVIPVNVGLHFGDGNEKIESNNTNLTINSGVDINLTATNDINIPADVGLTFGNDGEIIEGDGTNLTIKGGDINLTAEDDVNLPADIGLTFGNDGEKIEGDGTDLTISGNNIKLTAVEDVVVPADVGITFGTGEKIEGNNTDLTITSGADIKLTAAAFVEIPANIPLTFDGIGHADTISSDGTDMTIAVGGGDMTIAVGSGDILLEAYGSIYLDADGSGAGSPHVIFKALNQTHGYISMNASDDLIFRDGGGVEIFRIDGSADSLLMASTKKIEFNDETQFIHGSSATVLSVGATDEIDLTATTIDINGDATISGVSAASIIANAQTLATSNLPANHNAILWGPITVGSGASVTIGDGSDVKIIDFADAFAA